MRSLNIFALFIVLVSGLFNPAEAGCCNTNYWCDGDPSFLETPDVTQHPNAPWLLVSWSNAYLRLAKCVDYFYLEYSIYHNITNPNDVNYTILPVNFDRRAILDDWQDPLRPLQNRFWSNITVDFDTDYIIRIVAVDKGSGWGEHEGKAIVFSKPIVYRTVPKIPRDVIERRNIERLYPPNSCSQSRLCSQLAAEWILDVSGHVNRKLNFHDPEFLPPISVIIDDEDGEERKYEQGRIHHLSKATVDMTAATEDHEDYVIKFNVTFSVRPFRVSYGWSSFMTEGILSMYYTCGEDLPMAIFLDVDEDEVLESLSTSNCSFPITAQLVVPMRPGATARPGVESVTFPLIRKDFKYDVTWFSAHLHELDQMWPMQKKFITESIKGIFREGFDTAFTALNPRIWLKKKFKALEDRVRQARERDPDQADQAQPDQEESPLDKLDKESISENATTSQEISMKEIREILDNEDYEDTTKSEMFAAELFPEPD